MQPKIGPWRVRRRSHAPARSRALPPPPRRPRVARRLHGRPRRARAGLRAALPAVGRPGLAGRRQSLAGELQPPRRHRRRPPRLRAVDGHAALVRAAGPQLALQRLPLQAAQHPGDDDRADARTLATIEDNGFPWQQDTQNIVVGYNAYSPLGRRDRAGGVRQLRAARRTTRRSTSSASTSHGKIVLVRYGENFRGVKAHLAEQHGAEGRDHLLRPEGRRLRARARSTPTARGARRTRSSAARSSTSGSTRATR